MDMAKRLDALFPGYFKAEIDQWIKAGREYADRLDKLPHADREAVAQLFAAYGLSKEPRYKQAFRAGIDVVIAPFYPGAGHESAP